MISLVLVATIAAAPLTFDSCAEAGFDAALVSGLFSAQRPANHPPLTVHCERALLVKVSRGEMQREVSLADVAPSLRAQTLALVLVEVASGRTAPKKPRPVVVAAPVKLEPPVENTTVVEVVPPPAPEPTPEVVVAAVDDAPKVTPPVTLTPAITTTVETTEITPGHEQALRLTGGFTLGFGVLTIASALAGSMLLGLANTGGDRLRIPGWTMIGVGVASLVAAAISVGLWFGERDNPGTVAIAPKP